MRIAILTQPLNTNYGGILQAWALQQVLLRMGHSPITVDRQYDQQSTLARTPGQVKRFLQDTMLRFSGKTLYQSHIAYIRKLQSDFIKENVQRSIPIRSDEALRNYFQSNEFDAIIVGSDQVWRPRYSPRLQTYFLDFVSNQQTSSLKRIAYAASFGVEEWEYSIKQTNECYDLAQQFDAISVREKSAQELCRINLGVDAEWVLDPTLLLDRKDYVHAFGSNTKAETRGVFTYVLDETPFKTKIISEVQKSLGIPRFKQQPHAQQPIIHQSELKAYQYPVTSDWVNAFHEAEFVVTDSFHGTVFALLFEKPFIAIANSVRGAARFESLLSLVGMQDRLVYEEQDTDLNTLLAPVDFSIARSKLQTFKTKSIEYLKKHL